MKPKLLLDKQDGIDRAKAYLPKEGLREEVLFNEFDRWYSVACAFLGLQKGEGLPPATMSQVVYSTVAGYNANGDEGLTGSSTGGQSYSYSDLLEKLKEVMVSERKPRF